MSWFGVFRERPITSISPRGWIREFLSRQKSGLTGRLNETGYPFDCDPWLHDGVDDRRARRGWWPYEQAAYWIDGLMRCGLLLGDTSLIEKARVHIDHVLSEQAEDGYLGPSFMRDPTGSNRWPHALFFRAMMAQYDSANDAQIPEALRRHYLSDLLAHSKDRNVCNIESMLWTYQQTKDPRLLEAARSQFADFDASSSDLDYATENMRSDIESFSHGVTFNEIAKLPAILYLSTGDETLLDASVAGYRKFDRDHMLVDGVCSSTEHLRGRDPLDSHETCDIADYTWSIGYLLLATGRSEYADKIERACFNALPGAVRNDFTALQYYSSPNQVIAAATSNHNFSCRGDDRMQYKGYVMPQCCSGNVNRVMPNYAARMWLTGSDGGPVAALYGPSEVTFSIGTESIGIVETTRYPFEETVRFRVSCKNPVAFTLHLRIPTWCSAPSLRINDEIQDLDLQETGFCDVQRTFCNDDRVELELPMRIRVTRWPWGGIAIERGPIVYALPVEQRWEVDANAKYATSEFPTWNAYPGSNWNYALYIDPDHPLDSIDVMHSENAVDPWSTDAPPVWLSVPAVVVPEWTLHRPTKVVGEYFTSQGIRQFVHTGDFAFTPQLPHTNILEGVRSGKTRRIKLVPYGATHLRMSVFPWIMPAVVSDGVEMAPAHGS